MPQRPFHTIPPSRNRAGPGSAFPRQTSRTALGLATAGLLDEAMAPQGALGSLVSDSAAAEALLATLADEAIESMFAGGATCFDAHPESVSEDDLGPALTQAEQAALADEVVDAPPPQPQVLARAEFAEDLLLAAMPTDEELAALLSEDGAAPPLSQAAAAVAAELDDDSRMRAPTCDETARRGARDDSARRSAGAAVRDEHDTDAIQAEGAIEARASVNLTEPLAPGHEPISIAPAVTSARVRPLEPVLWLPQSPPAQTTAPERRSWWVAPLLWLNAPLRGAPHSVRESVGKLALLTLLNAVAVLVYVLVIRR